MTWTSVRQIPPLPSTLPGIAAVYAMLHLQHLLPWNPQAFPAVPPHTAFNIAVSFATNTNWQNYGGENDAELFHPDGGPHCSELRLRRFRHGRSGRAGAWTGARRHDRSATSGWISRRTLYILLPLSVLLALLLVSQGVIQNLNHVPAAEPSR